MSQQNKQASTSTPANPPLKRKRGRPRKDENLVHKEKPAESPQPAPSDDVRTNQHTEFDPSDDIDNEMVGQVVSGVIEGSFDAGYFLSVRTGNTGTLLRGVVFQPGLFTLITAANDVAPQAKMYQRREFPIPVLNLQSQVDDSTSIPQPERNNEHHVRLENRAPTIPALVLPSELQSDAAEQNFGASLDKQLIPQQNSKFGFENVSTKQDEIMQDLEDSTLLERRNIDGEGTKDVNVVLEIGSQRSVDICHGEENMDQVPQVQHRAVDFGLESSELAHDELKSGNPELQQTSAGAKTDTPQIMQSESIKDSGRDEITQN
ncbi:hypothetical protein LOK49_LG09G00346 [Camellia lanceoleosa]|uniref:Uncharacterized protein n=1 Tax=Camellia lanceoleosa TaxID=1840588 RepID=A0ACC0GHP4_9ERIC|nr:hypothetical protein LOK49_LG09G00346 [Camellia lanceoleosa]